MATHIREVQTTSVSSGTGFMFGIKALALQLKYIAGFGSETQDCDVYGTGDSVTDPDGANKQTLTDAAGLFSSADVGRTITVSGMSNPTNNDSFTITDYVSATQIKYVNAAGVAETSAFSWQITISDASFFSTEKNGSNGEINISGSDFNFKDATASAFVSGDANKWLLVADTNNSWNCGLYKISTYVDADTVTIDFRSGATEYPTQRISPNDDIVWHVLADDYQVPDRNDEWFQITTTHTYGWAIEVKRNPASASHQGIIVRAAVDGSFAGTKLLTSVYIGVENSDTTYFYSFVDETFVTLVAYESTSGTYNGFTLSNIIPLEAEKTSDNLLALMGCVSSNSADWGTNGTFNVAFGTMVAAGSTWNYSQAMRCYTCDLSYRNSSEGFRNDSSGDVNVRTSKYDLFYPLLMQDYNNAEGFYERLGTLTGFYIGTKNASARTAIDNASTKDKIHMANGHYLDWPGVTPQV